MTTGTLCAAKDALSARQETLALAFHAALSNEHAVHVFLLFFIAYTGN